MRQPALSPTSGTGHGFRRWRPGRPVAVHATLSSLRRGGADPAYRTGVDGTVWRATRTPTGAVLLRLTPRPAPGEVEAEAWGPGAEAALDGVPELLGAGDDPAGFRPDPAQRRLVRAHRQQPGWRVPRSGAVFEALAGAALEQVVTGREARQAYRYVLTRHGEPAPGPAQLAGCPAEGMRVPPPPRAWARIPSWEWLAAGVEQRRSGVVVTAAASAGRLEQTLALPLADVGRALRSLPGVGAWTAAEVRHRAHGDADAFSFGDYHVARDVSWALTGTVMDDDGCAEVLEPYRGHRYRVQRLLELAGATRPRRGPRMTLPRHTPRATGGRS